MLGQPASMLIPQVIGFRLTGMLPKGATATDLVLTITEALRRHGVVGKFVEFFGDGLRHLTIADRATLGNMCPEYGATVAIFPIDDDDARLPAAHRPRSGAGAAGRGLCARAGTVPHRRQPGGDVYGSRLDSTSRPWNRALPVRSGRRTVCPSRERRRRSSRRCRRCSCRRSRRGRQMQVAPGRALPRPRARRPSRASPLRTPCSTRSITARSSLLRSRVARIRRIPA